MEGDQDYQDYQDWTRIRGEGWKIGRVEEGKDGRGMGGRMEGGWVEDWKGDGWKDGRGMGGRLEGDGWKIGRGPGLSGLSGLDQDKRGWVEDWKGEGWKIGRGRGGRLEEGGMEECKLKEAQSRMNVAQRKRTI